jgi:hypothetical protein
MQELEHMLESIYEYLLISGTEWDLGADCHSRFHQELEMTSDQLKKKINKLLRTKVYQLGIPAFLSLFKSKGYQAANS